MRVKKFFLTFLLALTVAPLNAHADVVLAFRTMYGVDGPFINRKVRGVLGDELPWQVGSAEGLLESNGHLRIKVRGLVFPNRPEVPPEKRGINDEDKFRALVSCLVEHGTDGGKRRIAIDNIVTEGFKATRTGDADIDAMVRLPAECAGPVIFILSGSEDKWFAITGTEQGGLPY
jgi:hypothetical protein